MDLSQRKLLELSHGRGLLKTFLADNGIAPDVLTAFDQITEHYLAVNEVINISALKTFDDIYIKHYLDSIFPYKFFSGECCDVGCGGGFPCLPLAVVTGLHFTGIDGVGKKLTLIGRCKSALSIENISAEHARSEDMIKQNRTFDTVCARAVADTDKIVSLCAPLVKPSGRLILYKTQNDTAAKQSTETKYKVKLSQTIDYVLTGTNIRRRLFVYEK